MKCSFVSKGTGFVCNGGSVNAPRHPVNARPTQGSLYLSTHLQMQLSFNPI